MVKDALKNYIALASGLSEVGRQRAIAASKALVAQGEATAEQVSQLAEDLVETSKTNRTHLVALVRSEVDKALSRVGLATADEVRRMAERLQALESALRDVSRGAAGSASTARSASAAAPAAGKATPAKAAAKATKATKTATKPAKTATKPAKRASARKATSE